MKLSDVVNRINGNVDRYTTDLLYYIGGEHFESNELEITNKAIIKDNLGILGFKFHFAFQDRDVIFMARNPHLRKAGMVRFSGLCSDASYILRSKDENILTQEYLAIQLQSDHFWDYCESHKVGSVNFANNWSSIANYEFDLPTIDKQREIADKVWAAYEVKKAYRSMIKATDEMVKSQFIEMFGDQNTNDKCWSESLVKDEFKLSMGKTPARNNPECWDNGNHKWVSISDMSSYARYTGDTSEYITDYAIADSGIKPVPKGTIIMSFKLSIGRTAITSEDIYTNEAIMAFADFDEKKFNIDFLHFLIANKNWLLGAKQAVKGQTLNKESIGNAKIIIPPIEMQEQFASIYNQADKSKFMRSKSQFIEMFGNGNWEHKTLGEVGSFKRGGGFQKSDFVERGIPCIHYGQIHTRFGPFIYSHLTDISSDLESKTKFAEKGDLIIAITSEDTEGSCKSTAWLGDYPVAVGGHAAIFHHCMKPVYMSFFFKSALFNYAKREYVHGTKVCEIKPDDIAKIFVPCPPISLQEDFSAIAEQADKSKLICLLWKHCHCRDVYTK